MEELTTGYELSRNFFDWCFENPEKVKPNHIAMYFFIVEHWNRLGQKDKFGLPMEMTKDAIGIKNYKTYASTFNDLVDWNFIKVLQKSKNQYSANIIAIVKNTKATTKALSKASLKHNQKQVQGIVGIDKPITIEPITYNNNSEIEISQPKFNFKKSLLELGVSEKIIYDWLVVRKDKKASNTETAFIAIKNQIEISGLSANECIKIASENSWSGFKAKWIENLNQSNGQTFKSNQQGKGSKTAIAAENLFRDIASDARR